MNWEDTLDRYPYIAKLYFRTIALYFEANVNDSMWIFRFALQEAQAMGYIPESHGLEIDYV